MNASTHDSQALENATTGDGLSGDQNDARSPNPAPGTSAPATSASSPSRGGAQAAAGTAATPDATAIADASKPGTEPPSEAGKSDKPKVTVPAHDANGELPSPGAVGEAG